MLCECLCQVQCPSSNKNKSLTFFISYLKISHHRRINLFGQQVEFCWVKSPAQYLKIPAMNKNAPLHHELIVCFCYHQFRLVNTYGNYLSLPPKIINSSCNWIKSLTFLMTDVNISHDTEITSFPWKDQFPWINSPFLCSSTN